MSPEPGRGRDEEPAHDVLAAEEFAMPAVQPAPTGGSGLPRGASAWGVALGAAGGLLALLGLRRRAGR